MSRTEKEQWLFPYFFLTGNTNELWSPFVFQAYYIHESMRSQSHEIYPLHTTFSLLDNVPSKCHLSISPVADWQQKIRAGEGCMEAAAKQKNKISGQNGWLLHYGAMEVSYDLQSNSGKDRSP